MAVNIGRFMLNQVSKDARPGFFSRPESASDLDAFAFMVRSSTGGPLQRTVSKSLQHARKSGLKNSAVDRAMRDAGAWLHSKQERLRN
jgi:hypothetical protein